MDNLKELLEKKQELETELNVCNQKIKTLKYYKMLDIEKIRNLEIGKYIKIDTFQNIPSNSISCKYIKYLGIEDIYPLGYYQVKIEYKIQGCSPHIFYHNKIEDIYNI